MGKRSKRKKLLKKLQRRTGLKHPSRRHTKPSSYKDNFGNTISPIELAFPVIRYTEDNQFESIGTGFFFHPAGGFISARHNFYNNKDEYDDNCYAIHSVGRGQHLIRKVQYFEPHPIADIGVGMLRGQLRNSETNDIVLKASLSVSLTSPNIDDEISTLAYPRMKIKKGSIGTFPCDKYTGKILEYRPEGTGKLKSECFITNMEIKSGSSGGPVLRGNHIIGVNCSSFDIEEKYEPISFITPISLVFDLELKDGHGEITTIKQLMDSGHIHWIK